MSHLAICRQFWLYVALLFGFSYNTGTVHAQNIEEEKSFTAPRSLHEWVFLGNTETSKWEYDQRTLIRSDSTHIKVRIKETPLKNNYCDVRGAKMWEQRSIQGYSDTLRMHPQFYYEGYERYGFSVLDENIDLNNRSYSITYAADYDTGGLLLGLWECGYDEEKTISGASPENMLSELFSRGISRTW